MKLRLHDGTIQECSVAPWKTTGDKVTKWLVVIPGLGGTFLTPEEFEERRVTD